MAKLSQKFKEEWEFFLNKYNRITFNKQCKQCELDCKQSYKAQIVFCPNFKKKGAA